MYYRKYIREPYPHDSDLEKVLWVEEMLTRSRDMQCRKERSRYELTHNQRYRKFTLELAILDRFYDDVYVYF